MKLLVIYSYDLFQSLLLDAHLFVNHQFTSNFSKKMFFIEALTSEFWVSDVHRSSMNFYASPQPFAK
jgi:hypothetical protein